MKKKISEYEKGSEMSLTGIKDIDLKILQELTDSELGKVCTVNKRVAELCNDETFWRNRLLNKFKNISPEELNQIITFGEYKYKEFYIFLSGSPETNVQMLHAIKNNLNRLDILEKIYSKYEKSSELFPSWIDKPEFLKEVKRKLLYKYAYKIEKFVTEEFTYEVIDLMQRIGKFNYFA